MGNISYQEFSTTSSVVSTCMTCRHRSTCLPQALGDSRSTTKKLDSFIHRGGLIQKGKHIYRESEEFDAIYVVRDGVMMSYETLADGKESVTGFHFPGEIIGLDGISKRKYTSSVKSLDSSTLCGFSFYELTSLFLPKTSMQHYFFQLMSLKITEAQNHITRLHKTSAEQRIAWFLLNISSRNDHQHLPATCLCLAMSRAEIGSYLGLTIETVSRTISRLVKRKLIAINMKAVIILDHEGLANIIIHL